MASSEASSQALHDLTGSVGLKVKPNARVPLVKHQLPVAIASLVLAVVAFAVYPVGPDAFVAAGLAGVLVVVSATDLERRIIPNRVVLPAMAIVLLERIAVSPGHAPEYVVAMLGAGFFLMLPNLLNRSAIGMGDVKLAALLGAALGWNVINALALGFLLLVPVALFTLVRSGIMAGGMIAGGMTAARNTAVPFGPFLALGGLVFLLVPQLLGVAIA
jgi:prepilin signal peptidase PulO-like enzyme (type II secretory pathway)